MLTFMRAVRSVLHTPVFTLTVLFTLTLGVGLTDAIFTVVDSVLLRPLGYPGERSIVALETRLPQQSRPANWIGGSDYLDLARQVNSLESTAYYSSVGNTGIQLSGTAEYVPVAMVSPSFFKVLGPQPVAGRAFESSQASGTDALVSLRFAREHFGSSQAALQRVIKSGTREWQIVGVLPSSVTFPDHTAVWLEVAAVPEILSRSAGNQSAIARRREGTSPQSGAAELAVFSKRLQTNFPEDQGKEIEAVSLQQQIVGPVQPTLRLLSASVLVVLLIVCTNLTHMQLVRSSNRSSAALVRIALGASKWQVMQETLFESLILGVVGSLLAAAFAVPVLRALLVLAPSDMPRIEDVTPRLGVFLLCLTLSVLIMVVSGLLPLVRMWRSDVSSLLRGSGGRSTEGSSKRTLGNALMVTEIMFAVVLLVGAILLAGQLLLQSRVNLGFAADQLLALDTHLVGGLTIPEPPSHPSPADLLAYEKSSLSVAKTWEARVNTLLASLRQVPGVKSSDAIEGAPMGFGAVDVRYTIRGKSAPPVALAGNAPVAFVHSVSPGIFTTLGVPILNGRGLQDSDRFGTASVVVISSSVARTQFPMENPLGRQVRCGYDSDSGWWTIVGVVGDIRNDSPASEPVPTFYVPLTQHPQKSSNLQVLLRTLDNPASLAPTVERLVQITYPDIAVAESTMADDVRSTSQLSRLRTLVFGGLGLVSLLLSAIGIYGVTAYSVAQRLKEFGLRLALGSTRRQLIFLVLHNSLRLTLVGALLGMLASFGVYKLLGSLLGSFPPFSGAAYLLVLMCVLGVATLAALLPASYAARTDPMQILRSE